MRDVLTALAFLVILVLSAALVVPPFIDWEGRRGDLEAAMSRAAGVPIETRGEIELRLLPSPRLRVDGLTLGIPDGDALSLVAQEVVAELELTGLLRGEVRFRSISMHRANLRVPSDSGTIRLPDAITAPDGALGAWALDDLRVSTLDLTTISADLGPRHLADLRDVVVTAQNLAGPWRVDGLIDDRPFRLATGQLDEDGRMQLKLVGGGEAPVRFDVDAILALEPEGDRFRTNVSGKARIVATPPPGASGDVPQPVVVETGFVSEAMGVALTELGIEFGDPSLGSRLEGSGFLRLDDPRLGLQLEGRRLAADAILAGPLGEFLREQLARIQGDGEGVPVDLTLSLGSIGFAQEELLDVAVEVTLDLGVAQFHDAQVTLPGASRLTFSGDVDPTDIEAVEGRASLRTQDSDALARFLRRVGLDGPWMGVLQGQSLDISGNVSLTPSVYTIRELAFQAGDSVANGEITYREPAAGRRGLIQARILADGIDISALPKFDRLTDISSDTDLALTVEANAVRFEGDEGAGRIVANISSDGSTIIVDALEISDLAGAAVEVSGRISEDGGGLISGSLVAARAAPLLELLGRFSGEEFSDAVPDFLRSGAVDLALFIERVPASRGLDTAALQTSVEGQVAGGPFQADVTTIAGRTESVSVSLATDDTRAWLDLDHPLIVDRPSSVKLDLRRAGSDRFAAQLSGDVAGLRFQTTRPFSIDAITREIWDGEVNVAAGDARPAMALFGHGDGSGPSVPADLRLSVTRDGASSIVSLGGRIAGDPFRGRIDIPGAGAMNGQFELAELSLPWIVDALALGVSAGAEGDWRNAAFSPIQRPISAGRFSIAATRIMLGNELTLTGAAVDIELIPDGLVLSNLEGSLAEGRIAGQMTLRRTSPESASVVGEMSFADLPLTALEDAAPFDARMTGTIDFGGSGESFAGLVSNLAGGGRLEVQGLSIPEADPEGITRGLDRALLDEDPLGGRRLQGLVEEELQAGPLTVEQFSVPVTLVGGVIRLDPLNLDPGVAARAEWSGNAAFDLTDGSVEVRGLMRARAAPAGWSGAPPTISLGWAGPLASPDRIVDVGPLTNGVAGIVLQRELDQIEAFEREANERARRMEQLRMERARQEDATRWQEILRIRAEEEEARRQEEEARLAEEARIAEEARLAEEVRLAEEARLAEEEARALGEEERRLSEERARLERQRAEERELLRRLLSGEAEGATEDATDAEPGPIPPPLQLQPPSITTQ